MTTIPNPVTRDEFAWREECCSECGGSGMRGCMIGSGFVESECHGCGGEGSWSASCADCREEKPLNANGLCAGCAGFAIGDAPVREPYVPSAEYLAWCAEADAARTTVTVGDPLLNARAA